ncbi:hypothetical protein TNCV_2925691 [Trichonephila clavipes]|nr:hypothetical protein TNCV_2925691 [Trichonephila clavipes]
MRDTLGNAFSWLRLFFQNLPKIENRMVGKICLFYLSNARAWLFDHWTSKLPVPTDDVVSLVFIKSSAFKQVVTIHPGIAAEQEGHDSSHVKPVEVYSPKVMSDG